MKRPRKPRTGIKKTSSVRGGPGPFPIVGIGASAGGLEAMTSLLKHLPRDTGVALVLVQHLDPTHESALTTLLARSTGMPVEEARNNVPLKPDHLYVIPPNKLMVVSQRRLRLTPRCNSSDIYTPIDHFLRSLAREEGSRAIGVILSGSGGSDGTQGLLAIKSAGGITFAQSEKTAKYPSMPASAVAAGCVDSVLSPDRIARELARLAGHPYVAAEPPDPPSAAPAEDRTFDTILALLRQKTSVDFTHYKHATLRRRIQRRMVLHKCDSLKAYADFLRSHADEVKELYNDILIHVTGFFRDPAVYRTLKRRVFPRLVRDRGAEEPIRIWAPGCSTGEEAYSLAMAVTEFLQEKRLHFPVQIFGTDINETALEKARAGLYQDSIRSDLSSDRIRRFFTKAESGFRVNKGLRQMCIFARQNVVADPPFSNLDLVSCRNVLIYLGPALQRKVMPLFHYALKPAGYLLLGVSETIGGFADLFSLMDRKAKIYARKATRVRATVAFGQPLSAEDPSAVAEPLAPPPGVILPGLGDVQRQADRIVLTHHSPPGVIINRQMEVLQFRGRTGPYLEHAQGEASLDLMRMAREGLVVPLRTVISRAVKQDARVRQDAIRFRQNGDSHTVSIEVVPFQVPPSRERFYLIIFDAAAEESAVRKSGAKTTRRAEIDSGQRHGRAARGGPGRAALPGSEDTGLATLREELASTRESLQAIIEEQEATNEELRSANEEIMSSNEELQSINEELETAKEELQSTNEELTTLNDELEGRNSDLEHVNNDLQNLMASVNIPVIMVGGDMRIRRFTSVAEKVFNLIPGDVGRPLTDINFMVSLPRVEKLVAEVIDSLQTRELEARDRNGIWWSVRVRPYKTTDNKIDGVIIALVNIDVLKTSMEQIRRGRELATAVVDTVRRPMVVLDADLIVQQANEAFFQAFRVARDAAINHRIYDLAGGQWNRPDIRALLEAAPADGAALREADVEFNLAPPMGRGKFKLSARKLVCGDGDAHLVLLAVEDLP